MLTGNYDQSAPVVCAFIVPPTGGHKPVRKGPADRGVATSVDCRTGCQIQLRTRPCPEARCHAARRLVSGVVRVPCSSVSATSHSRESDWARRRICSVHPQFGLALTTLVRPITASTSLGSLWIIPPVEDRASETRGEPHPPVHHLPLLRTRRSLPTTSLSRWAPKQACLQAAAASRST